MDRFQAAMKIAASPNAEPSRALLARWTLFILWLSVLGIVFLTFYPFQAFPMETAVRRVPPFFAWFLGKPSDPPTDFLNVVLFVPFGFGPPVVVPQHRGFGSRLLQSAFPPNRGETSIVFAPDGVRCTFRFPSAPA